MYEKISYFLLTSKLKLQYNHTFKFNKKLSKMLSTNHKIVLYIVNNNSLEVKYHLNKNI